MTRYSGPWGSLSQPESTKRHDLGPRTFLALTASTMALGFGVAILTARITAMAGPGALTAVPAGVLSMFIGFEVSARSHDWRTSLVGHLLAHLGLGFALAAVVGSLVLPALAVTTLGLLAISGLCLIAPRLVQGWGAFLIAALGTLVLLRLVPTLTEAGWFSIDLRVHAFGLAVLAYVDRYLSRAFDLPRTLDNVIDTACALYLDVLDQALRRAASED